MHKYAKNEEGGKGSSTGESESLCGKLVHPKTFYKPDLKQVRLQNTQALTLTRGGRLRNMQRNKGEILINIWNHGLHRSYMQLFQQQRISKALKSGVFFCIC